jgi:hypothetical protein
MIAVQATGSIALSFITNIIALAIIIGIYVSQAIILNRLYYFEEGRTTILGWIPLGNIYLIGKTTLGTSVGWVLLACPFIISLTGSNAVASIYSVATFVLFIYACVKYSNLKKAYKEEKKLDEMLNNKIPNTNTVQNQMNVQQTNLNQPLNTQQTNLNQPLNVQTNTYQQPVTTQIQNQTMTPVVNFCTNCGTQVTPGTVYCHICGTKLN